MDDFEETVLRQLCAMADAINRGDRQIAEILSRLPSPETMRKVATIIINAQGDILTMSGTTPTPLVNCANPAAATRALEVIDVAGGTALPTVAVTSGNAALVAIVVATALTVSNQFTFGVYPVSTAAESNDPVTVTATLPDGNTLTFDYLISGTGETMTIDSTSSVGAFVGAPAVPSTPT